MAFYPKDEIAFDPYHWQTENHQKYFTSPTIGQNRHNFYLLNACPGAGKTVGTGKIAKTLFDEKLIDFVIILVPTVETKYNFQRDWKKFFDLELTVLEQKGITETRHPPSQYQGCVLTYQHLLTMIETFRDWANRGVRLYIIPDEIQHLLDNNAWGHATAQLVLIAAASSTVTPIGITGTAFRHDERPIAFVKYDEDNRVIADHTYSYREAVRDHICKPVTFWTEDGGILIDDLIPGSLKISEAVSNKQKRDIANEIFRTNFDGGWLQNVIERCHDDLMRDRLHRDPASGLLLVARPGIETTESQKHVRNLAKMASRIFGHDVPYVVHDDKDAVFRIDRFRRSMEPAITAVNMISEGVNIPRLSHLVFARTTESEMLFRQVIGRIIRSTDTNDPGEAKAYIAAIPLLVEFAARMEEEAAAGLREREERQPRERRDPNPQPMPNIIGSFHSPGGAVTSKGDAYSDTLMEAIRVLKAEDPEAAKIPDALLAKMWSLKPEDVAEPVQHPSEEEEPLETKKTRQRALIAKLQGEFGKILYDHDRDRNNKKPGSHWSKANYQLYQYLNVEDLDDLMNNHPLEKADHCIQILEEAIRKQNPNGPNQ